MEKIVTETIDLIDFKEGFKTFPEIQKLLDEGYCVKHMFLTKLESFRDRIALTVHLIKIDV